MNSIDQKVVEMKFDNSQFESAVSQTMSTLEKFKSKLNFKGAEKGLDSLNKSTSDYQYTLQDIGQSLSNLEQRFGVVGTIGARVFEKLTDSAYSFVTKGINNIVGSITQGGMSRAMNLEQARFQMQGIFQDAQRVEDIIYNDILPELQGTPFSLDQAAVVIGQLGASGVKTSGEIRQATRAISGLAAMSGRGFDEVGRIFSKVAGQGNMMGGELQQLSTYGINAAANIADYFQRVYKGEVEATDAVKEHIAVVAEDFGLDEAAIRDAASKRKIYYEDMAAAMDDLYGPHAQKSTQMYTGALEDLKAALARIGAEPAALKLNFLRDAFNALVPAVDAVNAVIKPFWSSARDNSDAFKDLDTYLKPFKSPIAKKVQETGWAFQKLFVKLDKNNAILRVTRNNYEELGFTMEEASNGVYEFKDAAGNVFDEKQALMNPRMLRVLTASTKTFVNIAKSLGKVIGAIGTGIYKIFPIINLLRIGNFMEFMESFTSKLIFSEKTLKRIRWIVQGIFTPLGLAIRGAVAVLKLFAAAIKVAYTYLSPFVSLAVSFFGMIGKIIAGVSRAIRHFSTIFRDGVVEAAEGFEEMPVWATMLGKIQDFCTRLADKFDLVGKRAYYFLNRLHEMPVVQEAFSKFNGVIEKLHSLFKRVTDAVSKFVDKLDASEKLKSFTDKLDAFLSSTDEALATKLVDSGMFDKFGFFAGLVDLLTGSLGGLSGVLKNFGDFGPLKGIRGFFADLGEIILGLGRGFVEGDFFVDRLKDIDGWFAKYKKLGGRFKNGFVPALKALGDTLPQLLNFKDYGEMLTNIGHKISSATSFIFKTLGLFGTGVVQDAAKGVENLSEVTASIREGAKSLGESEYLKPAISFLNTITESFKQWAENMDVQSAKRLIISLAYFGTCLYYLNTINNAARAFRGLTKIAETVASGVSAIGKMADAISLLPAAFKGMLNAFKLVGYMAALSVALIGIAAAMFIISKIDPKRLAAAAGIVVGIIVVVGILLVGVNKLSNKLGESTAKTMLTLAGVIGSIAFAVLAIAASIKLLSDIDDESLGNAVGSIAGIIVVFGVVLGVLSILPKFSGSKEAFGNVSAAAWALVGIAAGIRTMVEAIKDLADVYQNGDEESIRKAVSLVEELIVLTGVFGALAGWGKHGFASGMGIIPLALGLKIIIGSIIDIANTLQDVKSLNRAMTALKGLGGFVAKLGLLFVAIGVMNALSGIISKGDFILSGKGKMGGALLAIAEVIAGVWVVAQAMMQLGTLTDAQIENGIRVLKAFGILVGVISAISFIGGNKVAAGAGAFAGLAVGLFLLAEGIVALGETEHFADGFGRMGLAVLGLIGSVVLATKLISSFMTVKQAASIALLAAAMFGFAISIRMMAECPWESLMFAIIGLVATMAIAAGVMALFSEIGPLMLPIAGVFALLGVAAIGLGAGIFLLTLALSALIPLIIGLGEVPMDQLKAGLKVLKEAASGLSEVFGTLAGGLLKLAGGLFTLGVALIVVGVGGVVLAVGIVACAAAVFLFAGSLIVLYEVLSAFFPSVVKPVESGMVQLIDTFTRGLLDPTVNTVSKTGDEVNNTLAEKGDEGAEIADEKAHAIADKYDIWSLIKENGFEGDMDEIVEMTGMTPEEMGMAWDENSGSFTGAVDGTVTDAEGIMSKFGLNGHDYGLGGMSNFTGGITDGSSLPIDATSGMFGKIAKIYEKEQKSNERRGALQTQKLYGGMASKEDLVRGEATKLANYSVPPDRSSDAYDIGLAVSQGIASGIAKGASAVRAAAQSVINDAISSAKQTADVNSPSKRTIPIGSAIGEGLVVGMNRMSKNVSASAEDLVENGIDSITEAMQRSAATFDSDLDFTPTITPVVDLTNVDQSVNQMGTMFSSAFGVSTPFGSMNASLAARSFYDSRNQNARNSELNKLANSINGMTDTMNSRSLNNYINIDGATDPEAFADGLIRSFKLNARTV